MKHSKKTYTTFHFFSSIFMTVLLLCLTLSLFFVKVEVQTMSHSNQVSLLVDFDENNDTELPGDNFPAKPEEKTESSVNTVSEYLTEHARLIFSLSTNKELNKCKHADLYVAFHGELISPPPEV